MAHEVTEQDFRMPEYRDAKVEEYEFRDDGKLVRKDRWLTAVFKIASMVGVNVRNFEIEDVIRAVETLVEDEKGWISMDVEMPPANTLVDLILCGMGAGTTLMGAMSNSDGDAVWGDMCFSQFVINSWRLHKEKS